jgi:RNA polymerase sigma-70 factor, ECF subfamily
MNAMSDDREGVLVARARDGDVEAFETLVVRHADRVHAVVLRFGVGRTDAEEVVQDIFVRAWRALPRFEGRSKLSTWLYRIAFNEAHRRLKRRGRSREVVALDEELADDGPSPHARAETAELGRLLERALRELPERLRAPVVLRDIEGLTTEEAASVMGLREAAFKSRLHRGRVALRDALEPQLT